MHRMTACATPACVYVRLRILQWILAVELDYYAANVLKHDEVGMLTKFASIL